MGLHRAWAKVVAMTQACAQLETGVVGCMPSLLLAAQMLGMRTSRSDAIIALAPLADDHSLGDQRVAASRRVACAAIGSRPRRVSPPKPGKAMRIR